MRQQYEQAQHHGGKETEKQGNQCEQQERMQQAGPLELHEKQTNSSQNEEREKECLELREEGAHKGGDIDGSELQELQRQALPLDGSIPSSTSHRSSQGVPFAVHCKEPAKGKQSKATGKPRNEEGEQPSLAFERISEKWLKHEMQALLREECHQRQIVKRRDEQQHESLQHHPPLERPCVPHEQKQQVEDLWDMHQPACQQMQQELVSRHEGHIQARPHERITAQQEKLKKGKHAAIHLKQQEKQSNQKQLKIQQPTSGSKQRSVPLIRRRSTCCQPWEEDIQEDQPFETPKMGEQKEEQLLAKQKQLEEPQEEGQQTLRQHEKAKHQQLHSPAGETGEDSGEAPKQEEQQVGPRQQKSTTCETEEVKPSRSKKPMEVLQRHQQLTQSQQQATQVHMQEQHEAPIQEDARQSLQLNEVTLQEASRQKVQQALQKGRKPTHLQKCQQKQQLLTKQEGYHQQQLKEEREQTQTRQETQAERQKTQGNQEQKEDRLEGNQNPRGQKQQGPYEEVPQRQEHSTEGLNSTEHQKEKESPEKSTPQKELTKQDGQQNGQQESLEGELPLQTEQQPLSTEKHKIENQQHGVREMNRREGQILEENQRLQTEQHKSLPNHRCFQQKAPQHDLSKGSLPQTQVQSLQQQPHQQQQERQQEQKQQQKRQRQQQHDIHQQKDQAPEQQVPPQQQGQRPKGHPEGNSALTRRELLRLSFVPLLAVNENEYYLQHHRPSNTTSSSPLMPWRTTTSTQQRPVRRMPLPDNPSQPLVTTPRRRPYEGQRSGDADAKAPAQAFQQPNGRHGFSKTQQHLLNQHWTPLEVSHQQTSVNKQAADGASRNSFRRKNHILIPPPPPPAAFTQLTHHSHEQWRMAPTRGSYQPKNPRARQRLLQQEQRRLQKEPKKAAADLPLQAPEDFARHPETQQNLHRQSADLQQGLQQHQQLHGCDQQVQRELAAPRPCKRGDKRSSRGSHSGACGPDSAFPFTATPGSRKTWAQKAVELPPKRELGNSKDRRTDGVHRSFIDAEEYVVGADHRRGDNEKPESGYHDRRDRRFGKSDTFPTQHPPTMQAHTLRQGRQALQAQAAEQQQGNTRNPIVLQVHQQLTQARLEFLEETARGQARLSRLQAEKEARQKEEQQEQNVEQPKPEQGEQRHGVFQPDQQHQYQQQRQQQQHEEHENSMLHQHPPHYQQQTVNGPGQQPLHEQERQQAQDSQHEEQQHPYGVQQSLQQPSLTEQQLQQDTEVANLLGASIQQSLYTHSPSQALHQLQQQQLHQGIELPHEHEGLLSGFQRQQCQPQDTCGQQGTRQPQQLLGVQEQQVWLQRHEQLEHRYQQEQVQHIQQQQDQLPLQQPLIYRQQYTTLPQQPYHVLQQQYPLAEQQQQAWLQLQLHLSLQQHQHAWFLMNQQRSWLLQQQHAWTPNQQHLWALQQQEFWRQQQHLWQLQQPHVWLQQQQHLWLQHHQQASIQQQLLHQQQQQQQDQLQQHGPAPFQHHVNYCNSYIPPHVLSGVILVAAENAENIRQFSSCGVKMPPPWDGCIPSGNIRLGFCRACLQYVHLDAHLLPFISATTAASSPTLVEGSEEPAGYFNGQGPHQAEFLPHEQRLSTASADAAGGPPGISSLQERACEGPGGSAEIQDDMLQQNSANAAIANNSSHDSQSMHTSSSSSNNDREAYNEYPASNSNTSGNNRVYNSCSNNSTGSTAQRNHHTSRRTWEEGGNSSSNNNGSSSMAGHFANFEAFESFRFSAQNTRRPSGQIDSTGTPAATANAGASILQTNTQDTYQTQLNQPLQQQLYKGSLPLRGLVTGDTADPSYRNAGGFSSFNPSAPVFVPVRIAQPTSPSFAAAVAATAAAANQESLSAGAQASPAVEIRPGNNEPTSVQRPISSCGQTFPVILQQQPQSQEQLQQLHNVNQPGEQNRALQVPLPHASGPHTCDGQSHIQQPQHTSQTMHQFVEAYQHSYSQNHQQQRNGHQQNEQQQNEQQQSSRTHVQQQPQWSQYHFPSPIPGSISGFVSSADSSTPQGSLLIIGACLQCWQFVIRPPALCLLDQFRARGTGGRIIFV
ncbi:AGAP004734-PA, related [Eimeria brunetti]|uniref:AGAP004734-PA, related n=1 Tax=Eimeria brunetti TaxID=51314 RepID=U6LUP2_9EIME|nr:AGAP004734-PA, related [Eimeria brunetti]